MDGLIKESTLGDAVKRVMFNSGIGVMRIDEIIDANQRRPDWNRLSPLWDMPESRFPQPMINLLALTMVIV